MEQIKANELRHGNKLLFLGKIVTFNHIDMIRPDGIFWIKTGEYPISHKNFHFKPIPLDESILLSCGFEKLNYALIIDVGDRNTHGYKIIGENTFSLFDHSFGKNELLKYGRTEIKYLNQLQNLYFAIEKTELEINLKELTDKK